MDGKFFVNTYFMERCYGGPQEGGWWYDCGEPIESINLGICSQEEAEELRDERWEIWRKRNEEEGRRDISSVLSTGQYQTYIEDHFAVAFPSERPHYE